MPRYQALKTSRTPAPDAYTTLTNFYEPNTNAYFNGKLIEISDGTIQGCCLSNSVYDLGVKMLSEKLKMEGVKQVWVCDDLTATGNAATLKTWRTLVEQIGPEYGYIPKAPKCHLVTKDPSASQEFKEELNNGMISLIDGMRYLGAPIGNHEFSRNYIDKKLRELYNYVPLEVIVKNSLIQTFFNFHF